MDFSWTTGGNKELTYIRSVGAAVHAVTRPIQRQRLTVDIFREDGGELRDDALVLR
jgi:hypothetical protein